MGSRDDSFRMPRRLSLLSRRPRVVTACPPLRFEAGAALPDDYRPRRVAVLAHWSEQPLISRSTARMTAQLADRGYDVIVSSSAPCSGPLMWPDGLPDRVRVFRRINIGYDFGSWAAVLDRFPGIRGAYSAILLNDSLVGPFAPIDTLLAEMERDAHPVWGMVSTSQDAVHLQSHFVAYRQGILGSRQLRRFWSNIRVEPSKSDLIRRYEIGLAPILAEMGVEYGAGFEWESVVVRGGNPTSAGWRRLMLSGFPFVKRELLLRPPPEVPDTDDVPAVVQKLFGEDVWEWL